MVVFPEMINIIFSDPKKIRTPSWFIVIKKLMVVVGLYSSHILIILMKIIKLTLMKFLLIIFTEDLMLNFQILDS